MKTFKIIFTVAQIIFVLMLTLAVMTDTKRHERNRGLFLTYLVITVLDIGCIVGMWF